MNELKKYVNERISQYHFAKPESYDESFYRSIGNPADIENKIANAERLMASYETESHPGYKDDVEDRALAVYQCFVALRKSGQAMSDIKAVNPNAFDAITREQIDDWFSRFDVIKQKAECLHSRFVQRPDLYR